MPAEPSVSPADTPTGDRWHGLYTGTANDQAMVNREALAALLDERDALLAVGERDKAEIERLRKELLAQEDQWIAASREAAREHDETFDLLTREQAQRIAVEIELSESQAQGERDRRQIAQLTEVVKLVPRVGRLRWLAAVLDAMDEHGWPEGLTYTFTDGVSVLLLQDPDLDTPGDAVQRDLRALADALDATVPCLSCGHSAEAHVGGGECGQWDGRCPCEEFIPDRRARAVLADEEDAP